MRSQSRNARELQNVRYQAGKRNFSLAKIARCDAPHVAEHLATSDRGVIMVRRIWHKAMEDVANGKDPKRIDRQRRGMLEVGTFHGHVKVNQLRIGRRTCPLLRKEEN